MAGGFWHRLKLSFGSGYSTKTIVEFNPFGGSLKNPPRNAEEIE
jgi:hypothetical protein